MIRSCRGNSFSSRSDSTRARSPQSPLAEGMEIFAASSAEQEALAIDLQVRRWLLEGRQPLGIVTEDRRLARRVRALLERSGIHLQDSGGWALSTTSAAAALERWLETVEEDFDHQPLLDVLKSPFIFPDVDPDLHGSRVYRLEQDRITSYNVCYTKLLRGRCRTPACRQALPAGIDMAAVARQPPRDIFMPDDVLFEAVDPAAAAPETAAARDTPAPSPATQAADEAEQDRVERLP